MDNAKSSVDLDIRTSLIDSAEQELLQIDSALARAVKGEYGTCLGCEKSIPLARLETVPVYVVRTIETKRCGKEERTEPSGWGSGDRLLMQASS
jgi:RNA polymerase-binding transcription factor DksA